MSDPLTPALAPCLQNRKRTCDYATFHGKQHFVSVMKTLLTEGSPGLFLPPCSWYSKGKSKEESVRHRKPQGMEVLDLILRTRLLLCCEYIVDGTSVILAGDKRILHFCFQSFHQKEWNAEIGDCIRSTSITTIAPNTLPSTIQDLPEVQGLEETVKASCGIAVERQTKCISLEQEILEDPIIPAF
ncbi:hypothetical protein STEG23_010569 [Scotinomys teguina]